MKKTKFDYREILGKTWKWSATDKKAWKYLTNSDHLKFPETISSMIPSHRTVIQAGGHCGLYPYQYASFFDTVYTYEPSVINYECLVENTKEIPNIKIINKGLGNISKLVSMNENRKNTGNHSINESDSGSIEITTIDSQLLSEVDLIHLDLEGYEKFALEGAENTIKQCKPLIVLETNDCCLNYGYTLDDLTQYLNTLGYKSIMQWENDQAYAYCN